MSVWGGWVSHLDRLEHRSEPFPHVYGPYGRDLEPIIHLHHPRSRWVPCPCDVRGYRKGLSLAQILHQSGPLPTPRATAPLITQMSYVQRRGRRSLPCRGGMRCQGGDLSWCTFSPRFGISEMWGHSPPLHAHGKWRHHLPSLEDSGIPSKGDLARANHVWECTARACMHMHTKYS